MEKEMSKFLPIGSVVQLNNGESKIMIINRFPLYNNEGTIGYFDYSAVDYPVGSLENRAYFFNREDIAKVWFEGYTDESEEMMQKKFKEQESKITVPHFTVEK